MKKDMTHTIIFNAKSSYMYYKDEKNFETAWIYNCEFVEQLMHVIDLELRAKGWIYLRNIYDKLGMNANNVPATLGWDKKKYKDFKYIIIGHKDKDEIEIILNPEELT